MAAIRPIWWFVINAAGIFVYAMAFIGIENVARWLFLAAAIVALLGLYAACMALYCEMRADQIRAQNQRW